MTETKTLGAAIDEIVGALKFLPEASRSVAIRAACEALGVTTPLLGAAAAPPGTLGAAALAASLPTEGGATAHDIRTFTQQKQPSSAAEMACLVAYYLQRLAPEGERKSVVNADDMQKYFVQGNFPLPMRIQQLLPDARAAGYFDNAGRGTYQLNAVGHNLVAHGLPRGTRDTASPKKKRPAKKAASKKRKTKKHR